MTKAAYQMQWGRGALWWVAWAGLLPACKPADAPIVAEVGPHRIAADALRACVAQLPAEDLGLLDAVQPQDAAAVRRQYLQLIIDRHLLLSEARAQGLDSTQLVADETRAYYQDQYPAALMEGERGALLVRLREQRSHEVRVYPELLERSLPDSLLVRKAQQWGALLSQRGGALAQAGPPPQSPRRAGAISRVCAGSRADAFLHGYGLCPFG